MHKSRQNYGTSLRDQLRSTLKIGDDYHLTVIACQSFREHSFSDLVLCYIRAKSLQHTAAVSVCVRVAVRNVDLIVVVLKLTSK